MRNTWFFRVFIGPHGLRSGWGLLLYILIFAVSFFVLFVVEKLFGNVSPPFATAHKHGQAAMLGLEAMRPGSMLILYGTSLSVALFVPWIMSRIERRRLGVGVRRFYQLSRSPHQTLG